MERTGRIFLEVVAAIVAGIAVLTAIAAWWLSSKPLSLDFLTPSIERALSAADGSFSVSLERTVLTWGGWSRTLDVRAQGVRAIGAADGEFALIPEISVSLSTRALLQGRIAPTHLEVITPRIRLVRDRNGDIQLGFGAQPTASTGIVEAVLTDLLAPPDQRQMTGYLTSVSIVAANFLIDDQQLEVSWHLPVVDLRLSRDQGGLRGALSFDADIQGQKPHFDVDLHYDNQDRAIQFNARFRDLEPRLIAPADRLPQFVDALRLPFNGELSARVSLTGDLDGLNFSAIGRRGTMALPAPFNIETPIERVIVRGQIADGWRHWRLDELFVDAAGPRFALSGIIDGLDSDTIVEIEATAENIEISDLNRLWPESMASGGRSWVRNNIRAGRIGDFRLFFSGLANDGKLDQMAVRKLEGSFNYEGLEVHYFDPLPPVIGVGGVARFDAEKFDFEVGQGTVNGLTLASADMRIDGLGLAHQDMAIELVARGEVERILNLLNQKPLKFVGRYGLDSKKVKGEVAARIAFHFPLDADLRASDIKVAAAANARDVTFPGVFANLDLRKGALSLQLDGLGMDITGTASLGPIAGQVSWRENFQTTAIVRRKYGFKGVIDEAGRTALGFDDAAHIKGPLEVDLIYSAQNDVRGELAAALNLTETGLHLPELGWEKKPGTDGSARLRMTVEDGRPQEISAFEINAGGLEARGDAGFNKEDGQFKKLTVQRLAFGRTEVGGRVLARADGGYDIVLRGAGFDATHLLQDDDKTAATQPPLDIDMEIDRVWVGKEGGFDAVRGNLRHDGTHWAAMNIEGTIGGKEVVVQVAPADGARSLLLRTADGGAVLKAFGLIDTLRGGALEVSGRFDDSKPNAPLTARAEMKNFRLLNAPLMAQILSIASLSGPLTLLDGEGLAFIRLELPFVRSDTSIEIGKARAYGNAIGITTEGRVDLAADKIELAGTVVPAYSVNRVIGAIPLVGQLLTGGQGEGVFAVTYRVSGPLDKPVITVNPLSALAPGFLRNLFDIFDSPPSGPSAPASPAPAPPETTAPAATPN